jgi:hypothetical protein
MAVGDARRKLVFRFLEKHKEAPSRTLARLLHEKYPHEFKDVESARSSIRTFRGNMGSHHRAKQKHNEHFEPARPHGSLKIPEGIKQTKEPLLITEPGKWLIIGDLHVPYHDKAAIEIAVNKGVELGCTNLYINGDLLDWYALSTFDKRPDRATPKKELKVGKIVLRELARHFPGRKIFKCGNHDARFELYLARSAQSLVGISDFQLDKVMKLAQLGYEYVASKQWAMFNDLPVLHGHELQKGLASPVNVGRGVFNQLGDSGVVNHWHKTSRHVETSGLKRRLTVAHSIACLCEIRPEFAVFNRWNLGFGTCELLESKEYHFRNFIIENGKAYE